MTPPNFAAPSRKITIGVDVGGTNIDAVALALGARAVAKPCDTEESDDILAAFKGPTTLDPCDGIMEAVRNILQTAQLQSFEISAVVIGTTHFLNAVVTADARRLRRVAVIRLGAPYTAECPPFIDMPPRLRSLVEGRWALCKGGLQIDGRKIGDVDETEIRAEARAIRRAGIETVVVVGVYSCLDRDGDSQEERVARWLLDEFQGQLDVVCSRQLGSMGLVEREGAAILNASLLAFARSTLSSFQRGIRRLGLKAPIFLTQNDGTLCSLADAARLPIRTFSSGATNSMCGASYLARRVGGLQRDTHSPTIVIDIGGTTSDVGVLLPSGIPRQAAAFVEVGGVRTSFTMPDVVSVGLGGGSVVRTSDPQPSRVKVGPESVGFRLVSEAIAFGGETVTATDVAIAAGLGHDIGDTDRVRRRLSGDVEMIDNARRDIRRTLERAIAQIKTWPEPATVLLVGGGAIIAPEELEGINEIVRPPFAEAANAVGAAVARVAGEVDTVQSLQGTTLAAALEPLKQKAIEKAIEAGARRETVRIVDIQNLPVTYVTNQATRLIVRAVGDLDHGKWVDSSDADIVDELEALERIHQEEDHPPSVAGKAEIKTDDIGDDIHLPRPPPQEANVDVALYKPFVDRDGLWHLSTTDLRWIADGCGLLGVGGGGSTYYPFLMVREVLRAGGRVRIVNPHDLDADVVVARGGFMGSPSVSAERLQAGSELERAVNNNLRFCGMSKADAVMSEEIGGGNGIQPLLLGSSRHLDVPVVDADLQGRAYPFMYSCLPAAYNVPGALTPATLSDALDNDVILPSTASNQQVEEFLRVVCERMGSKAFAAMHPLPASICRKYSVTHTVSLAWRIGRALHRCRTSNDLARFPEAVFALQTGRVLFQGKVVHVRREVRSGFTWGQLLIVPLSSDEQMQEDGQGVLDAGHHREWDEVELEFQNEYLIAKGTRREQDTPRTTMLAVVPDLISVLDTQSGEALGTHELRYGLRVTVIALAANPKWTTPEGLSVGGPAVFGLKEQFRSTLGAYREPHSVIDEFRPR